MISEERLVTSSVINKWNQKRIANSGKHKDLGAMRNDTRRLLEEFYAPSIERLATLLHDDRFKTMRL